MRIVITGAFGFIGAHFVKMCVENLPDIADFLLIDKNTYAADKNRLLDNGFEETKLGLRYKKGTTTFEDYGEVPNYLNNSIDILEKDICDVTAKDLGKFDYLINFAAETHVDNSIKDGRPFMRSNVEGVFNLLEICRENKKLKKFVQISTDEVYGDIFWKRPKRTSKETDNRLPSSYYSASKAAAEMLVEACAKIYNTPTLILRSCNNFGPGQHKEKFIPKALECLKSGDKMSVYGDGEQIREWMHVEDNCSIIFTLVLGPTKWKEFNIGSRQTFTNNKIIEMINRFRGNKLKWEYVEDRKGHDKEYGLDVTELFGELRSGPYMAARYNKILNTTNMQTLERFLSTF